MADQNYREQIKEHMLQSAKLRELDMRECNHKADNRGRVMALHDSKVKYPGKDKMPDTTAVCTRCERVFESQSYTKDETQSAEYMLLSVAEQIKLNANLSPEDKADIAKYYDALDVISSMLTYYNNMVDKLAQGGGNNNKHRNTKGHFGVSSDMFGSGRQF